ncbi:MAG TPA: adenylate/guanylate cyclase domain-containing protein [Gemmatimonadales bacterium]|jgi:adenylate cyclase|nr:adenylate/guanylate cyclase domain-containing protein [Gemmatimonadales bacterium]
MARWQLVAERGGAVFPLPEDRAIVVGRAAESGIQLEDDTISRQHAELRGGSQGIALRDLGSSNGVRVNGARVTRADLVAGDRVEFGEVGFRVEAARGNALATGAARPRDDLPDGTRVRAIDLRTGGGALARLQAERLARLVELARTLSGEIEIEHLLATVVDQAAALLPADRVALLLSDTAGELRLVHSRNRLGAAPVVVPQSIAQRAMAEKSPVVTENALGDARFQSGSVVSSQVRAALCVPLLADQERVLGVLYVDSLSTRTPFSENDAALCFAFGGLAAVSIAKAHYAEAARREALARANLERFFAPDIAARIAVHPSEVRPGGERRPVTVLMSDVRGFVGLAETLPPEAVAEQLSEYFAAMVELVFVHGGTLDKFAGDALLAIWGAPLAAADDADRAVAAARAMQAEVAVLNERWLANGKPELGVGIGLHHGEAFTGMIGSPRRLEYTVIGDVVNVAARLCKEAGAGEIVLSEQVRGKLTGTVAVAVAVAVAGAGEPLPLRGRGEPVVVYRLGGAA